MEPDVPLSIPEVNPEALEGHPKIVAVPNCTTITAMLAIGPLHRAAGLRSLMISSYQSVSGAGWKGTRELVEQVDKLHGQVEELGHPDAGALPGGRGVRQDDRVQRGGQDRRVRPRRLHRRRDEDHGRAPEDPRVCPTSTSWRRRSACRCPSATRWCWWRSSTGRSRPDEARDLLARRARRGAPRRSGERRLSRARWRRPGSTWRSWAGSVRCPTAPMRSRCSAAPTTSARARRSTRCRSRNTCSAVA